jgi:hypothetical protein
LRAHFGDTDPISMSDYFANGASQFTFGIVGVPPTSASNLRVANLLGKQRMSQGLLRRKFALNSTSASLNTSNMNAAFSNTSSLATEIVQDFNVPAEEMYAFEYTGYFVPVQPGEYRFGLTSDDGSDMALFMNNRWNVVTTAYGYKPVEATPPSTGTVTIPIAAAYTPVPLRLRFHEQGGGQGLNLFWTPPGQQTNSAIPFSVLRCTNPNRPEFPDPTRVPDTIVMSFRAEDTSYDGLPAQYSPGFAYWPNATFTSNITNTSSFTVNNGTPLFVVQRFPGAQFGKDVITYGPSLTFFQSYSLHTWRFT